jgi:hypothetical protein
MAKDDEVANDLVTLTGAYEIAPPQYQQTPFSMWSALHVSRDIYIQLVIRAVADDAAPLDGADAKVDESPSVSKPQRKKKKVRRVPRDGHTERQYQLRSSDAALIDLLAVPSPRSSLLVRLWSSPTPAHAHGMP